MRILIQSNDPRHLARMAAALEVRGDTVHLAENLPQVMETAVRQMIDGVILDLSEEAVTWYRNACTRTPALRAVFLTPRAEMGAALARHPQLSILPSPGTALAARFLLSPDPASDPACRLGDYHLMELDALGRRTHIFRAVQCSIDRPVALRLLNQELEGDQDSVDDFLEDARAKAAVNHDRVGTVFQALQDHDAIFYTAEALDGPSLAELAKAGKYLSPRQFLEVLRTLASALAQMEARSLASAAVELRHIHLAASNGVPRMANQATHAEAEAGHHIARFLHSVSLAAPLLDPQNPKSAGIRAWVGTILQTPPEKLDLQQIVTDVRGQLGELEVPARSQEDETAGAGKSPRTAVIVVACMALVAIVGFLVKQGDSKPPVQRIVEDVDATIGFSGSLANTSARGQATLAAFNIDKYEVTIRQYAQFLESIGPAAASRIAHPDQAAENPKKKDYKPKDWDIWYPLAVAGMRYDDHLLTLDCPVFNIDWWDAQAYARWKNRRLPTEDEWEYAAGGPQGRKFPWGDTWDPARANGADKPAALHYHDAWSPVDLPETDVTAQGVRGMAGGVSEWTASSAVHPEFPDRSIPVVKGGSFGTKGIETSTRVRVLSRNESKPWLGFRTAADSNSP